MDLITTWKNSFDRCDSSVAPFVLPADAEFLKSYPDVLYRTQEEARRAPDFILPAMTKTGVSTWGCCLGPSWETY